MGEKYIRDEVALERTDYKPITIDSLKAAFEYQAIHPDGDDLYYAAACTAMREAMDDEAIASDYENIISIRAEKKETPQYLVNLTLRALNYAAMDNSRYPNYPVGFNNAERWKDIIYDAFNWFDNQYQNDDYHINEMFEYHLCTADVQSNVHQRAIVLQWINAMFRSRFNEEVKIADVGCSVNHASKSLIMPDYFYKDVTVLNTDMTKNDTATSTMNFIKNLHMPLGSCTGFDRENMLANNSASNQVIRWDKMAMKWVRANTLRPTEQLDASLVEQYDLLDYINPDNIRFIHADFSVPTELWSPTPELNEKYDIVFYSTVLYQSQNNPENILEMLSNGEKILADDGLIVVSDFAAPKVDAPLQLDFYKNWEPWTYRTYVYDPHHPQRGFQEFARWYNGRCGKVILSDQISLIDGIKSYY